MNFSHPPPISAIDKPVQSKFKPKQPKVKGGSLEGSSSCSKGAAAGETDAQGTEVLVHRPPAPRD